MSTYKVMGYRVIAEVAAHTDGVGLRHEHNYGDIDSARVAAWDILGKSTHGGSISGRELIDWVIVQEYRTIEAGIGSYVTIEVLTTKRAASQLGVALYNPDLGIDFNLHRIIDQPQPHPVAVCADCGKDIPQPNDGLTTGYGIDNEDRKICYACCAKLDQEEMRKEGKITLYLTGVSPKIRAGYVINEAWRITNWPGSLRFTPIGHSVKIGRHNWGIDRYDTWFVFDGDIWHGVSIGNNSELLHCKRTKERAVKPTPVHYVGMAGLRGYMPNYTTVGETRGSVAEDLGQVHELSGRKIAQMRRDWWLDLDLYEHGNEYCEIAICDCGKSFEECCAEVGY